MCEGIAEEFRGIDLGDKRLNKRSVKVLEALATNPEASINAACHGWSDTLAAYRFFNNPVVHPEEILRPHRAATEQRMREHPVVLIVQDTTELDFTSHPAKDARCLDTTYRFGCYDHTHLAVTPDKLCLGVVGSEQFDRAAESIGQGSQRKHLPIEQKESFRWLTGYRLACELQQAHRGTRVVSIADCEADIYEIFVEAQAAGSLGADFIIRARENRCTPQRDSESSANGYGKVRDELERSPVRTRRTIELNQTPKRTARCAGVEIRALRLEIKPPDTRRHLPVVKFQVVLVTEVNGPGDDTEISWLLMTTLPVETVEEVLRVIDYYIVRWMIEIYFRVLKTGCRVEEIQLETTHRLKNCLAFYKIIAWRVVYLTYLSRVCPTLSCTALFDDCEWKPVWKVVKKQPLPQQPPTLEEFLPLLTQLGGYNNRAREAPPGPQVFWVGIRRMLDFALAWLSFGPDT